MDQKNFEEIIKKAEEMKKSGTVDLSTEEDLSIAIMNLISLEEHFYFTGAKTDNPKYYEMIIEVREVRKELLSRMIDKSEHEGETWCISKHMLAATMRLIEVGTKLQSDAKNEKARETFAQAHKIYSLFWALRLKLVDTKGLKKLADSDKPWNLEQIMDKLVDCCDE
jgi:hypothetical protein